MDILYQNDVKRVERRFAELDSLARQGGLEKANELMSPYYRQRHSLREFEKSTFLLYEMRLSYPLTEVDIKLGGQSGELFAGWSRGFFPAGNGFAIDKVDGECYFTGGYVYYED